MSNAPSTETVAEIADQRYLVVSADAHVGPSMEHQLRAYCPQKYLEAFDEDVQRARSRSWAESYGDPLDENVVRLSKEVALRQGQSDEATRIRDMDADGVVADVIYHGAQNGEEMPFVAEALFSTRSSTTAEMEAVGCRIYNRWLADFISANPHRHVGLAHIPMLDIDAAVEEVRWARDAGLGGVNFPAPRRQWPAYTDEVWEPFWAVCEEFAMPLSTHAGAGDRWEYPGKTSFAFRQIEGPFLCRRAVWHLIFGGVFERYPALKLVITEQAGIWIPEMLRDLDDVYFSRPQGIVRRELPRTPSEYWDSNCYVGASMMSHVEALKYTELGGRKLMWGTDYPHLEGTYPFTRLSLQKTFAGIPPEHVRAMIGETAAEVYGMDVARLRKIADEIGPTVAELSTPPEWIPGEDVYVGFGFRDRSIFS